MIHKTRILAITLAVSMMFTTAANAMDQRNLDDALERTSAYLLETVTEPQVGSTGGEWAIVGIARGEFDVPQEYWEGYYQNVEEAVKTGEGVLHEKKYTEYSRVILALTAIGANPSDVAGYDLLMPLADYENTIWQGVNGAIWAVIALDSGNYDLPINEAAKTQATRQLYVEYILEKQLEDGGWSLLGKAPSDPDLTGMALQALANNQEDEAVGIAIEQALSVMSLLQDDLGGYSSLGAESSECVVQMMVALDALDISLEDERFVKNGMTLLDNLMLYAKEDGSFAHSMDGDADLMATEQALYAMVAARREQNEKSSLYTMDDVTISFGEKEVVNFTEQFAEVASGKYESVVWILREWLTKQI